MGCQRYYCEDGRKVKDEKDCYTAAGDAIFEISSVEDLNSKTALIQQNLANGKSLEIKFVGSPTTTQSQFNILETFGGIYREHIEKVKINYNDFAINPATEGLLLTHETWTSWGKLKLGANGSIKWVVPSNEVALFNNDGYGNAVVGNGPAQTKRTIDVQNNTELVAAHPQAITYLTIYPEEVMVKVVKSFSLTSDGMASMAGMVGMERQPNQFKFHNGQSRFSMLEDNSVKINNAVAIHRMNQLNMTPNNVTLTGGKYYHLQTNAQATKDSLLAINNVVFTTPEAFTSAMPANMNKEIMRKLTCDRDVEDARTIFPANFLDTYKGEIEMVMPSRSDKPWGQQNFVGVNNGFLKHVDIQNPRSPAQDGVATKLKFATAPILGHYTVRDDEPDEQPWASNGFNLSSINFGDGTDRSGEKSLTSYEKMISTTGYLFPRIQRINAPTTRQIPLNIKTTKPEYIDGIYTFVSLSFLKKVANANQIRGPTIDGKEDLLLASNLKIYIDPAISSEFYYLLGMVGGDAYVVLEAGYGIKITNCDIIGLLPASKQCFDWKANNAGKGGGSATKTYTEQPGKPIQTESGKL